MVHNSIKRNQLKKNILKEIIIRLDFQGVLQNEMEKVLMEVKPYLKSKSFNRYKEKIENQAVLEGSSIKETYSQVVYNFSDENKGYSLDLSVSSIILNIRSKGYSSFEDYSDIFLHVASIYMEKIDFFTVTRFGIRKINFCFVKELCDIEKYFESKFYDVKNTISGFDLGLINHNTLLTDGSINANLRYVVEQGELNKEKYYKVSLDSDVNSAYMESIKKILMDKSELYRINDILFNIFCNSITDLFAEILLADDNDVPLGLVGVENNE